LRNRINHDYASIEPMIIIAIVQNELPNMLTKFTEIRTYLVQQLENENKEI
jgi:uncharacterized protein with HEPN domain